MENAVLKRMAFFISLFVEKSPSFVPKNIAYLEIRRNNADKRNWDRGNGMNPVEKYVHRDSKLPEVRHQLLAKAQTDLEQDPDVLPTISKCATNTLRGLTVSSRWNRISRKKKGAHSHSCNVTCFLRATEKVTDIL